MDSVLIMMATYNGESFIAKQIDSILAQSHTNWHLLIQDDGSTDNTIEIIEDYCHRDTRIELIHNIAPIHGAYINFHGLANTAKHRKPYDFYMFCDQDDIWFPDKIETFVQYYAELSAKEFPVLCYADMQTIDGDGNVKIESLNAVRGLSYTNPSRVFFAHRVAGCNLFMNRMLFFVVPEVELTQAYVKTLSHDNYYTKFAAVYGKIYYIPKPLMQYRRHGSNTTGDASFGSFSKKKVFKRLFHLEQLAKDHACTYNQSLVALQIMRLLDREQPPLIAEIEQIIRTGGLHAVRYMRSKGISWGSKVNDISRYFIVLTGKYRKYLVPDDAVKKGGGQ